MPTRSLISRLELSSYRLLNKGDSDSDMDSDINSDSDSPSPPDLDNRGDDTGDLNDRFTAAEFKDKIFAAGRFRIYEIYNPEKEDHMYFEVPLAQNEEDSDDTSSKRKREEGEKEDFDYGHTYFALTGPDEGMVVCDTFDVVAHKVDPATDDDYLDRATRAYLSWRRIPGDNAITVTHGRTTFYNYPHPIKIDLGFGSSLKLNYLVITDSKLVTVAIHWLFVQGKGDHHGQENHDTDDIHICGNVSAFSEKHLDHRSVLLQTPKDKAVKVKMQDNHIPLSRSLVAVPYKSAFIVEADLYNPIDGSFVQGSATFPFREINTEMPSYVASDYISFGSGTHKIKVVVTVGL